MVGIFFRKILKKHMFCVSISITLVLVIDPHRFQVERPNIGRQTARERERIDSDIVIGP